ncbi:hypothetical protein H4S02_013715 [Coemansia sp. RSA 2611]|nr:hypothetical protein H4S02_013715 [Coemansia sp. RSA 2611]
MSRAVFFYRNIRTKQVLVCPSATVMSATSLISTQITNPVLRPKVIRPDHWTPLVVASGFDSQKAHANLFMLAAQPGHPLTPKTSEDIRQYKLLARRNKLIADMDMVESQVAQLARSLVYIDSLASKAVPQEEVSKIKLFWEDSEWIKKVEAAGLYWPKWIEHDSLEMKRGNIVLNQELRNVVTMASA